MEQEDKPTNPYAFPGKDTSSERGITITYGHAGMTLRDYFAGQYIAAKHLHTSYEDEAADAYQCADAMLKARLK